MNARNQRAMKASGKLLVLRGALEDFCTNKNNCLGPDQINSKNLLQELQVRSTSELLRTLDKKLSLVQGKSKKNDPQLSSHQNSNDQRIDFHLFEGHIDTRIVSLLKSFETQHMQKLHTEVIKTNDVWPKDKLGNITATAIHADVSTRSSIVIAGTDKGRLFCWRISWLKAHAGTDSNPIAMFLGASRKHKSKQDQVPITAIKFLASLNILLTLRRCWI